MGQDDTVSLDKITPHFQFLETMFTSVSNGIIYTKYTQNPHTIEPPFNIATQSASLDRYSLCKSPGTK